MPSQLALVSLAAHGAQSAQAQGLELDEARGVSLVVGAAVILKGRERLVVQAVRAFASHQDDVALSDVHTAVSSRLKVGTM